MTWQDILKTAKVFKPKLKAQIIDYLNKQNNRPMTARQLLDIVTPMNRSVPTNNKLDYFLRNDSDFAISFSAEHRTQQGKNIRMFSLKEDMEKFLFDNYEF
tara:strand:+ start:5241 stop:5543 length:303 start_codon:yes stop_codon:yes gene_type:complete